MSVPARLCRLGAFALILGLACISWSMWRPHEAAIAETSASDPLLEPLDEGRVSPTKSASKLGSREINPGVPSIEVMRDVTARRDFHDSLKRFFDDAVRLDADTRAALAQHLEQDIARYEQTRELSAGEALLLRAELVRVTVPDPIAQAERLTELTERYREQAERRMREHATRIDPVFIAYKDRERRIVEEVMALHRIPAGIDRDEYLRRRLQQERESTGP